MCWRQARFELISAAERDRVFVVGVPDAMAETRAETPHSKPTMASHWCSAKSIRQPAVQCRYPARHARHEHAGAICDRAPRVVIRKGRVLVDWRQREPGRGRSSGQRRSTSNRASEPASPSLGIANRSTTTIIDAASAAGLEGLIVMYGREDRPQHRPAGRARRCGSDMFIAGAAIAAEAT